MLALDPPSSGAEHPPSSFWHLVLTWARCWALFCLINVTRLREQPFSPGNQKCVWCLDSFGADLTETRQWSARKWGAWGNGGATSNRSWMLHGIMRAAQQREQAAGGRVSPGQREPGPDGGPGGTGGW